MNTVNLNTFFASSADDIMYAILVNFGWIPIAVVILWGAKEVWLDYIQTQWGGQFKKILLAIDIPKGNEQSVEAVESLFTYFGGAHGTFNLIDTYWDGKYQLSFSFEIVSINGYTQFIIRTPSHYRNLVESAVYSQYPDAEITEIEDYTKGMPKTFPDDEWDLWGGELVPTKNWVYPIKTYKEFQTTTGKPEQQFKDPMASLMDLCSSLNEGEQIWYQLIVYPMGFDWPKECDKEISKILKESSPKKVGFLGTLFGEIVGLLGEMTRQIADMIIGGGGVTETQAQDALKMMNLKPVEKKRVEAITMKSSKLGFNCKQRFIYIAKKEVINKAKGASGFIGYLKQFIDMNLNNFKPDMEKTITTAEYFFKNYTLNRKKTKLVNGYIDRDGTVGRTKYVLNTEELATMWHFPIEAVVKAPLVQKAPGRKAKPPISLPIGEGAIDDNVINREDMNEIFSDNFDDENNLKSANIPTEVKKKNDINNNNKEEIDEIFSDDESEEDSQISSSEGALKTNVPPSNLPIA